MAIVFDKTDKVILIEAPDTSVTVQALLDAVRNFEDEPHNMEVEQICEAVGKDSLGGEDYTGITLKLVNDWRVQFEDRAGAEYIACTISGGNLIANNAYDNNPIKPSAYTQVTRAQSTSPTIKNVDDVTVLKNVMYNKMTIDEQNSVLQVWDEAGTAVLYEWPLTNRDGNAISLQGTGPANRGVAT